MNLKNITDKFKVALFDGYLDGIKETFPELNTINSGTELKDNTLIYIALFTIGFFELCEKEELKHE
jgi:hypothetical protein